jgi:hypothetical protein
MIMRWSTRACGLALLGGTATGLADMVLLYKLYGVLSFITLTFGFTMKNTITHSYLSVPALLVSLPHLV